MDLDFVCQIFFKNNVKDIQKSNDQFYFSFTSMIPILAIKSLGGFQECETDSGYVKNALPYLKKAIPAFYKKLRNSDFDVDIQSASYQIVNGYNLKLSCRVNDELFTIKLYCNPRVNKNTVVGFNPVPTDKILPPGSWKWGDVSSYQDNNLESFTSLLKEQDSPIDVKNVLAVRQQLVNGMNYEVTFTDSNDILHSISYYQPFRQTAKATINDIYTVD